VRRGADRLFAGELAKVLEELAVNVLRHADDPGGGWGCAAVFPGDQRFQFAVADAGVGFRASLRRNPGLAGRIDGDAAAIRLALREGVSRGGKGNLGDGLALLRRFAAQLGGELWIASGSALYRRSRAGVEELHAIAGWRGAWICVDAPLDAREGSPAG
jgi:anti-sigma regulatory factor (Ser/Thr protein kinase)